MRGVSFSRFVGVGHLRVKFCCAASMPGGILWLPMVSFGLDGFDQPHLKFTQNLYVSVILPIHIMLSFNIV